MDHDYVNNFILAKPFSHFYIDHAFGTKKHFL